MQSTELKVRYRDQREFIRRTIRALSSIVRSNSVLQPKAMEILGVICEMEFGGEDWRDNSEIVGRLGGIQEDTYRNYKSQLSKAGWLVRDIDGRWQLNGFLLGAMRKGGISIMIVCR